MPQPDTQTEYGHHILAIDSVKLPGFYAGVLV